MPDEARQKAELTVVLSFFTLLALSGLVLIGVIVNDFACARASHHWPSVDGVVLSESGGGAVRYAYIHKGESYEAERVAFFTGGFSKDLSRTYRPGQSVRVYVDPEKPSAAVIAPGGSSLVFLASALLCGLLVFIGAGGLIRTLMNGAQLEFSSADALEESPAR